MSLRSLTPIRGVCSEGRLLGRVFAREGKAFDKPISPTGRGPLLEESQPRTSAFSGTVLGMAKLVGKIPAFVGSRLIV